MIKDSFPPLNLPQVGKAHPFVAVRLDGVRFGTYTAELNTPQDEKFMNDMDTVLKLCVEEFSAYAGYVISDEISLIFRQDETRQLPFDGKVSKMCSVMAGFASAALNQQRPDQFGWFDARIIPLSDTADVSAYLHSRRSHGFRGAIGALGMHVFKDHHKRFDRVSTKDRIAMLTDAGAEFRDILTPRFYEGAVCVKERYMKRTSWTDKRTGEANVTVAERSRWALKIALRSVVDSVVTGE